jgi:hypothetical protein
MLTRCLAAFACTLALAGGPARAATVTPLALPDGFTVKPEAPVRRISIAADHTVAAAAEAIDGRSRAFRWIRARERSTFDALPVSTVPGFGQNTPVPRQIESIAVGGGVGYVDASESWSGAYSGVSFEVQRWLGDTAARWTLPSCVSETDETDQHANAVDARGRIALTMDITGQGSFSVLQDNSGAYAPYAFVIDGNRCRALGRAVVLGLRGRWASGFRGYLNGHLAPTSLNVFMQRFVAVRWRDDVLSELGDGAAYAVNESGLAVGASGPSGLFGDVTMGSDGHSETYVAPVPHALAWDASGKRIAIDRRDRRSVAYDVADDGTAVGMLQDAGGKHYAFRWRAGKLQRLDDFPHPAGWRFESAYAIAPDGTIAGIGTYRGIATVFTWHE